MIVIDASVWLSVVIPTDIHFAEATEWATWFESGSTRIAVPAHFVAEVAGVLSRTGINRQFVDETIDDIVSSERFILHDITVSLGLVAADVAKTGRVRGSDAVYLALAQSLGSPLLTWDRQQRERGALFCQTLTPIEAMVLSN